MSETKSSWLWPKQRPVLPGCYITGCRCQMKLPPAEPGFRKHTQHVRSMGKKCNRSSVGDNQPDLNHKDCSFVVLHVQGWTCRCFFLSMHGSLADGWFWRGMYDVWGRKEVLVGIRSPLSSDELSGLRLCSSNPGIPVPSDFPPRSLPSLKASLFNADNAFLVLSQSVIFSNPS